MYTICGRDSTSLIKVPYIGTVDIKRKSYKKKIIGQKR